MQKSETKGVSQQYYGSFTPGICVGRRARSKVCAIDIRNDAGWFALEHRASKAVWAAHYASAGRALPRAYLTAEGSFRRRRSRLFPTEHGSKPDICVISIDKPTAVLFHHHDTASNFVFQTVEKPRTRHRSAKEGLGSGSQGFKTNSQCIHRTSIGLEALVAFAARPTPLFNSMDTRDH
jgi:hypothetical protein